MPNPTEKAPKPATPRKRAPKRPRAAPPVEPPAQPTEQPAQPIEGAAELKAFVTQNHGLTHGPDPDAPDLRAPRRLAQVKTYLDLAKRRDEVPAALAESIARMVSVGRFTEKDPFGYHELTPAGVAWLAEQEALADAQQRQGSPNPTPVPIANGGDS